MLKCYEYEYTYNNDPDTNLVFVWAESAEEAAAALNEYHDEVTADDLSVIDPNSKYYKAWSRSKNVEVYHVVRGELAVESRYDRRRDYEIDRMIGRA